MSRDVLLYETTADLRLLFKTNVSEGTRWRKKIIYGGNERYGMQCFDMMYDICYAII
jgi:hypothetical protein